MDFLPSDEQVELQRGVRDLLADRFPLERLPSGFDPKLWQVLSDTGVFTLRTELGLGLADAVLVFEELGRACVPGPLVPTFLAAGHTDGPVALADVSQEPLLVTHLDVAHSLLVLDDDSACIVARTHVTATAVESPLDPLTPVHELAESPLGGEPFGDLTAVRQQGALLTAALQVGLAARTTELAVDYAKWREQFGRPIGSFQAVKHLCADMFVRAELARVAVHAAAVILDESGEGAAQAIAGAKLLADEAASTNGRSCVQVHGGMGFTWEVPVHFFLKRAWVHATEFGTADDHAEELAQRL